MSAARPRLLDLFCGGGGAAMGYHRAGFEVVGVDRAAHPRYPFEFYQCDALELLDALAMGGGSTFDAIHASPPCQLWTVAAPIQGNAHLDLLTPTRERLERLGLPFVIENVPDAALRCDLLLCGSMFGLEVQRHRWFEFGGWEGVHFGPADCAHVWPNGQPVGVYGHTGSGSTRYGHRKSGNHGYTVADWRRAMGIDWMTRDELAQAIPPAYTEFIGRHLIDTIRAVAA